MKTVNQWLWLEGEMSQSFEKIGYKPEVLAIGQWPKKNPPQHPLIDSFKTIK